MSVSQTISSKFKHVKENFLIKISRQKLNPLGVSLPEHNKLIKKL